MVNLQKKYKSDGIGVVLSDIEDEFIKLQDKIASLQDRIFVLERAKEIQTSLLQVNGSLGIKSKSDFYRWSAGDPLSGSNSETLSVDGSGRNVLWGGDGKNGIVFTLPIQINSKTKINFEIPRSIKSEVFDSAIFLIGNRIIPITIIDDKEKQQFLLNLNLSKLETILFPPVMVTLRYTSLKQDTYHTFGVYAFNVET